MDGQLPFIDIRELNFRMYTEEDIVKISVMQIVSEEAINKLGHCSRGGIYDLRLGPLSRITDSMCETCNLKSESCMGHCGHISLPLPVYNPVFIPHLAKMLRNICLSCGRLHADPVSVLLLECKMRLLAQGYCHEALTVDTIADDDTITDIKIDLDEKEVKVSKTHGLHLEALKRRLDGFITSVISGDYYRPAVHTSTVNSVRDQSLKQFVTSIKPPSLCHNCGFPSLGVSYSNGQMIVTLKSSTKLLERIKDDKIRFESNTLNLDLTRPSVLTPVQARSILRKTWISDSLALQQMLPMLKGTKSEHPIDMIFMTKLLVIPPKFRPMVRVKELIVEHESSVLLKNVLRLCRCMTFLDDLIKDPTIEISPEVRLILNDISGATDHQKGEKVWQLMQGNIDNLLDANANKEVALNQKGVKQVLEKKAGLFRSGLMGKRVNFSARSVLAPDPALAVDEVGVPLDFARHLHYPVYVTPRNAAYLRKLVVNGPFNYPGAHMVEFEDGRVTHLRTCKESQRLAIAKKLLTPPEGTSRQVHPCKIVFRQMVDGDWVLMNRQPTLHRPSIQAHKVRVLPGVRVLSMPYANCKAYNADFDGDEMNLHFLQNELARSEADSLITTHQQYLTPKDGAPLAGLVQDSVVAGVMLTVRGQMFDREDYIQLVNVALQDFTAPVRTLLPAIMKPQRLWSGKQIVSTIMLNLIPQKNALPTFKFKTSIKKEMWMVQDHRSPKGGETWGRANFDDMTESELVMREGELLCGVLDKSAIGSTSYGLIHVCYELYGGAVASSLMTAFSRLSFYFLQLHGHTISSKEFLTPLSVAETRRNSLKDLIQNAPTRVLQKMDMEKEDQFRQFWESNHMSQCEKNLAMVDAAFTQVLGKATSEITTVNEQGLFRRTFDNSMRLMVDSGAKGSKVNMNQMASLFGPTAIDGKRMPLSLAGKTLPSFLPYDMNPRAGGYISTRFMTGMDPQSYFFLCIVGRDSLQHTAVKTANSGYMQRCLIKHLEGIQVMYDMTVRNSDGLVLQFEYGEDGLDVMKVPFLRTPHGLDVVVDNYSRLIDSKTVAAVKERSAHLNIAHQKKKINKWLKKNKQRSKSERVSGFQLFCKEQLEQEGSKNKKSSQFNREVGRAVRVLELQQLWWTGITQQQRDEYNQSARDQRPPQLLPLLSSYSGNDKLGVLSEALDGLIDSYYSQHYVARSTYHQPCNKKQVETVVALKALRSHVEPGEAVGAICAQAIGEPLTQMTLNTFHFAGRDELNVTLGVPRMVEILRTASKAISTPIMEVPFHAGITSAQANALKKKFTEVTINQVMHKMEAWVIEVNPDDSDTFHHHVRLRFTLLPTSHYKQELPVTCRGVLKFMEKYYFTKGIIKGLESTKTKIPDICETLDKTKVKAREEQDEEKDDEEQTTVAPTADDPNSDEEPISGDEDDDLADKNRKNKRTEQDYDDDEDEEASDDEAGQQREQQRPSDDEGFGEEEEEELIESNDRTRGGKKSSREASLTQKQITMRKNGVINSHPLIVDYDFDTVDEEWCELTLRIPNTGLKHDFKSIMYRTANQAFIHRIPGVKRAFVEEKSNVLVLRTEGVNVYRLVEWANLLDINRLYTNDIQLVARTFGIEAAQRSIIREIRAVQNAYNIQVDYRHLTLLADYFTCDGVYKACSRTALTTCQSTLQKMSYETSLKFLRDAVLESAPDRMQSPSARVAAGQVVRMGTNLMDILVDIPGTLIKQEKE